MMHQHLKKEVIKKLTPWIFRLHLTRAQDKKQGQIVATLNLQLKSRLVLYMGLD